MPLQTESVGSAVWIERGPALGGRLDAITIQDSVVFQGRRLIIVGSPGGGVWYRSQSGYPNRWFEATNDGLSDFVIVHLEVDTLDPTVLYGVGWNRLMVSTNNGNGWRSLAHTLFYHPLPSSTVVDRGHPFAQMDYQDNHYILYAPPCDGVWISANGGSFVRSLIPNDGADPTSLDNCVSNIAADSNAGHVWVSPMRAPAASGEPARVWRTTIPLSPGLSGITWRDASAGLFTRGADVASLAVANHRDSLRSQLVAMAIDFAAGYPYPTATAASNDDEGLNWLRFPHELSSGVAPATPRPLLHAGGDELFHGGVVAVYSDNLGRDWTELPTVDADQVHLDVRALFLESLPGGGAMLWVSTDGVGPYDINANVAAWAWTPGSIPASPPTVVDDHGLTTWTAYTVGVVPLQDGRRRVFVGSQDNAWACFEAAESSGVHTPNGVPPVGEGGPFELWRPSGGSRRRPRAYASGLSSALFRSDDVATAAGCGFVTWNPTMPFPPGFFVSFDSRYGIAVDPQDPDTVYLTSNGAMLFTTTGGLGSPGRLPWGTVPSPFQPECVAVDQQGGVLLGTFGGGVFKLVRRGRLASFEPWALNADPPDHVRAIAIGGSRGRPVAWLGTDRGLYRKGVFGDAVRVVPPPGFDIPYAVGAVAVDASCTSRIYAGVGYSGEGTLQHGGGVFFSCDGGNRWRSITAAIDLAEVPITDIRVDPVDPRLVFVASWGRGMWSYDWRDDLPACNDLAACR